MPDYEARIIEALRKSERRPSTLELARKSGLAKTAVIKYLATFKMAGKADFEDVGHSKLWRLLPPTSEGKVEGAISRGHDLSEILKEFVESAELTGFAVVDHQGLPLSAIMPKNIAPERLGALSSLLFNVGIKSIELADLEDFLRIVVEGTKGKVLACKDGKVLLIAFSKPDATVGALATEIAEFAKKINEVLSIRVGLHK